MVEILDAFEVCDAVEHGIFAFGDFLVAEEVVAVGVQLFSTSQRKYSSGKFVELIATPACALPIESAMAAKDNNSFFILCFFFYLL